jgi:lysophospholipase L1-like esterase
MWYLLGVAGAATFLALLPAMLNRGAQERPWATIRLLALGDSLTANPAYCSTLEHALAAEGGLAICRGYVGQGVSVVASHLGEAWANAATDVVVLAGVNDLASGRTLTSITERLDSLYREAKAGGLRVVALTVTPWMGHAKGPANAERTAQLNEWILSNPVPDAVVDTSVLGDHEGYLLPPYDRGDGLHMTPEGAQDLALLVLEEAF